MSKIKCILPALSLGLIACVGLGPGSVQGAEAGDGPFGAGTLPDNIGDLVDLVFPAIDFTAFLPPGAGATYVDPIFGSAIKRVSDARGTPDLASGGVLPLISHEYSTMSPFNADNSRLLLLHFSYFALYDGEGNYLRSLPFEINSSSEPRWSRSDPGLFHYLRGNELKSYRVDSGEMEVVHTFGEYRRISGLGESEISEDGRYRVLVGDNQYIFVYDLVSRSKGPVLSMPSAGRVDHVHLTPDNNLLVGWYSSGTGRFQGLELYDRFLNFKRQVSPVLGHMDVARDSDGAEVLLIHNSAHPSPPVSCQNAVVKIRLSNLRQTCMISFPWGVGVHISASEQADSFVVSTYSGYDPEAPERQLRFRDEILRLSIDGKRMNRLAHHWSRAYDNYSYQPKASLSRDGSKLVYGSNYRQQEKLDLPSTYTDVFLLCMENCPLPGMDPNAESGWIQDPVSGEPRFRIQEDDDRLNYSGEWLSLFHTRMSEDRVLIANRPGAAVEFHFQGSVATWVGYRGPLGGKARVLVDGQERAVVDTWQKDIHQVQKPLFAVRGLSEGEHLLRIEVLPQDNPGAEGETWVWVDAFDALSDSQALAP